MVCCLSHGLSEIFGVQAEVWTTVHLYSTAFDTHVEISISFVEEDEERALLLEWG
jgi:hypothetical protein